MRDSRKPFGAVNAEAWVQSVYELVSPIFSYYPSKTSVISTVQNLIEFALALPFCIPVQSVK